MSWSDEYVQTIWDLIKRRDEKIVELHKKLAEANEAVRELRHMINRAHTGAAE